MLLAKPMSFVVGMALFAGLAQSKPVPSKYGTVQNGHVPAARIQEMRAEVDHMQKTLEPARYRAIVADPFNNAKTDQERLAGLAAREIFFLVDRSGSMTSEDTDPTGKNRQGTGTDSQTGRKVWCLWDSAQEAAKSLFEVALGLDSDGVLDVAMWDAVGTGPRYVPESVTQLAQIERMFHNLRPHGWTPLAETLETLYRTKLKALLDRGEPFTVIVLTDGEPNDGRGNLGACRDRVYDFFARLAQENNLSQQGRETLAAFSFVQSGDDPDATKFLESLDDDMKGGWTDSRGQYHPGIGVDIIDTKKDDFLFGTGEYTGQNNIGPIALLWDAIYD